MLLVAGYTDEMSYNWWGEGLFRAQSAQGARITREEYVACSPKLASYTEAIVTETASIAAHAGPGPPWTYLSTPPDSELGKKVAPEVNRPVSQISAAEISSGDQVAK